MNTIKSNRICKWTFLLILWPFLSVVNGQNLNYDIYLVKTNIEKGSVISFDKAVNISKHAGYDNQPLFNENGTKVFYTAMSKDSTTDIQCYDLVEKEKIKTQSSPLTSEYSPTFIPGTSKIAFVRVEEDKATQRIWQMDFPDGKPELAYSKFDSVGYFWLLPNEKVAAFVLTSKNEMAHELRIFDSKNRKETFVDDSIGRCIRMTDDSTAIIYVKKKADGKNKLMRYNFHDSSIHELCETVEGAEDFVFYNNVKIWMCKDNKLFEYWFAAKFPHWDEKEDFAKKNAHLKNITRIALSPDKSYFVLVAEDPLK